MEEIRSRIENLKKKLGLEEKKKVLEKLEKEMAEPGFWQDQKEARRKTQTLAVCQRVVSLVEDLEAKLLSGSETLLKDLEKAEEVAYLSGEYDSNSAILSIHSGQGGTEAWIGPKCSKECI